MTEFKELTNTEINDILERYDNADFKEFRIGDLFEFETIPQAKSQKLVPTDENGVNYIIQSDNNNMFSRRVNEEYVRMNNGKIVTGNRISLGVTLPAVAYQPNRFTGSQLITMYSDFLNPLLGLYFTTLLSKQMYKFSYNSRKPGVKRYQALMVKLPTLNSGEPDYQLMEDYIEFIQQKHIQDRQAYYEKRIATAKTLI